MPDAIRAVTAAFGPGNGTTEMCCSIAALTSSTPGSLIDGIPASLTCAMFLPDSKSRINSFVFSCTLCSW